MITEDYVSFEVAKLLKEKGFDWECNHRFDSDGIFRDIQPTWNWNMGASRYSAPTLQMAMKWLREVHNIFIDITSRFSLNADRDVCFSYSCKKLIDTYKTSYEVGDGEWLNYEEACETGIKYCLENLMNK